MIARVRFIVTGFFYHHLFYINQFAFQFLILVLVKLVVHNEPLE